MTPVDLDNIAHGRVSVVIPAWNRHDLIRETLESLQAQTHEDWEAIVVDDLSTDGTPEVVRGMASRDGRVRLVQDRWKRRGASASRNLGASLAAGEFVLFLDSDDLLAPFALERRVQALRESPDADMVVTLTQLFEGVPSKGGRLWNTLTDEDHLDRFCRGDNPWITIGAMYRQGGAFQATRWAEEAIVLDDWEYAIRTLANGAVVAQVRAVDSHYRVAHGESLMQTSLAAHPERRDLCERRRAALFRVTDLLDSRGLLSELREEGLAYCHFRQAEGFAIAGMTDEAQRTLLQAAHLGLGSRWMWSEMRTVFRMLDKRFVRWFAWRYLPRRFKFTRSMRSKTLGRILAPEDAE